MKNINCILIRHGKTNGNIEKRYIGCRTDEPLCEIGISELKNNKLMLNDITCDYHVFTSPLMRCRQSAKILFPECEINEVNDLREIDFGEFENKNYSELRDNKDYQAWIDSEGQNPFPGGEAKEDFIKRTVKAFKNILFSISEDTNNTVTAFVVHGGSIMAIMSELTGKNYFDFQLSCGEAYRVNLEVSDEQISVLSFNRISGGSHS